MGTYKPSITAGILTDLRKLPPAVVPRAMDTLLRMAADPWATELHPEKIKNAEDGVYSCRVDQAYRVVWKHIKPDHVVICLIDKHDEAYRRASRQTFRLEDGVIKVADIVEDATRVDSDKDYVKNLFFPKKQVGKLFVGYRDQELIEFGVSADLLPNVRALEEVNELAALERLLPESVFNRLLEISLDLIERPTIPDKELHKSIERHQGGDALYQFVDTDEFKRALEGSMEEWMIFLASFQRQLAYRSIAGAARIKGIAGSGKTVVAIHRAYHLAQTAQARGGKILFLTFGNRLPRIIERLLGKLSNDTAFISEWVECTTIHQWCRRFLVEQKKLRSVDPKAASAAIKDAIRETKPQFSDLSIWEREPSFFEDEISYGIKGRAVANLQAYLSLDRGGRGTPLKERERHAVYAVFEAYNQLLGAKGVCDFDDWILDSLDLLQSGKVPTVKYVAAVVDEIQDLSETMMRLIRHLIPEGSNDLFLVGDGLQRLYPGGYSLAKLGINVTGRSALLKRNYRNTREIMRTAHMMMSGISFDDMEELGTKPVEPEYSVRTGPTPLLRRFASLDEELAWIGDEIARLVVKAGFRNEDIALLYRFHEPYRKQIIQQLGLRFPVVELGKDEMTYFGPGVKLTTFDSAKGLEFKVVFVVGVTDGSLVPRDDLSLEGTELDEYMARERRQLYVAMTRARDLLYLTFSRGQASRFLSDLPADCLISES